ncbi:MAG: molecular chaperone TorD family protein [Deferribacteraceae bacterium]|jgi:TorA maturation chaperone TorD|nr:molecular chaperone TorD family protein [Deferribacteraceae bacterium]
MSEYTDLINVFNGRAAFYELFTEVFNEAPNDNILKAVAAFAPHFRNMAEEIDDASLKAGADELTELLKTSTDLTELNRSFTTLFLLGSSSVPTAESVYLSTTKLLKQEPWDEIIDFYYKHNFGLPEEMKQTEEHISSEMLFMYYLSAKTATALANNSEDEAEGLIDAQLEFMEQHIIRWIPEMCDIIAKSAYEHVGFYKTIAKLLKGFLFYDVELLKELTSEG